MSMSVSNQDQSFKLFSCRWAWCRSSFSNNAQLVHHVVHDHVRCTIPVRRRDISMIKRAEEGRGESLKISELMVDMYSYTSRESSSHKPGTNPSFRHSLSEIDIILLSVEHPREPSSSLPSPPASSPALHSPHHLVHSPGPAPSPSPLSLEKHKPSASPNETHADQTQSFQLSQHSSASFASQNSIEAQLTQTQASDGMDQDEDLLPYHSSNVLSSHTPDVFIPPGLIHEHDELQWELSQHAEGCLTSDPISQSQSHHHLENLPVMSQPPSQLRLDPSAAVPLSPSSPASSPTFAVSTPLRQNWYQPPLKRRKRSTCNDKGPGSSPLKREEEFVLHTKSKNKYRSGTLQITPGSSSEESKGKHTIVDALPANRQNNLATCPDSPCDLFSQSSQDPSDLSEINSYPALQTQAPYQSQILTQF